MNSPDAIEESAAYEERRTEFFDLADRFLKPVAPRHKDTQPSLL
jgi:hypothetical protein